MLDWGLEHRGITRFENMIQYTARQGLRTSYSLFPGHGEKGQSLPFHGAVFPRAEERQ